MGKDLTLEVDVLSSELASAKADWKGWISELVEFNIKSEGPKATCCKKR